MEAATSPAPHSLPPRHGERRRSGGAARPVARIALLLALSLLSVALIFALTLLLARPPTGGGRHSAHSPNGYTRAQTGTVVQATETTATPARTEPTDVVPSPGAGTP